MNRTDLIFESKRGKCSASLEKENRAQCHQIGYSRCYRRELHLTDCCLVKSDSQWHHKSKDFVSTLDCQRTPLFLCLNLLKLLEVRERTQTTSSEWLSSFGPYGGFSCSALVVLQQKRLVRSYITENWKSLNLHELVKRFCCVKSPDST